MPAKTQFIADLKPGDAVLSFFLVEHARLQPFRDQYAGSFLSLQISDRTGMMRARVWEEAETVAAALQPGDFVKLQGRVRAFQDHSYIAVRQIRRARPMEIEAADFVADAAPFAGSRNADALLGVLRDAVRTIGHVDLRRLLDSIFGDADFLVSFCQARASPLHHPFAGGLLEHTVEMLVLSRPLLALFGACHADLLTAAILVHDIGRVLERELEPAAHAALLPTGQLLGHQALGDAWLSERLAQIPGFDPDLALRLRHCLLSHHGYPGAPAPATLEALALFQLNTLSAQLSEANLAVRQAARRQLTWTGDLVAGRGPLYVGQRSA